MSKAKETVSKPHGNVWNAICDGPAEAANMKMRSLLIIALTEHIKAKKWTQAEAAEHLGVSQPRISDLINGKVNKFSVEALIGLLASAGLEVQAKIARAA